jgi:hypothetical protein
VKKVAVFVLLVMLAGVAPFSARGQTNDTSARIAAQKRNAKLSRKQTKHIEKERRKMLKAEKKAQKKQKHSPS